MRGEVVEFDSPRGLGTIRGEDGVDRPFHCTAIADGSREVSAGAPVEFEVRPGPMGRWEATAIQKL